MIKWVKVLGSVAVLISCFLLVSSPAVAQYPGGPGGGGYGGPPEFTYNPYGGTEQYLRTADILSLPADADFGYSWNTDMGSASFSQTDVSLPGNFNLPVEVTRVRSRGVRSVRNQGEFDDWVLKQPRLSYTWRNELSDRWEANRCSTLPPTVVVKQPIYPHTYAVSNFFGGIFLEGLDGENQALLQVPSHVRNQYPHIGSSDKYTTKNMWKVRCLGASSSTGRQGFSITSVDGTTYKFDQEVRRESKNNAHGGRTDHEISIYASEITDKNGNWVRYLRNSYGPYRITSSDGRRIDLSYNSSGHVRSISANGRAWIYSYSGGALSQVTRPDSLKWKFTGLSNLDFQRNKDQDRLDCHVLTTTSGYLRAVNPNIHLPVGNVTVEGPYGAKLKLDLVTVVNGRISEVVFDGHNGNHNIWTNNRCKQAAENEHYVATVGVQRKTEILADGSQNIWEYEYEQDKGEPFAWHGYQRQLDDFKKRFETLPDGSVVEYQVNRHALQSAEGKIVKQRIFNTANANSPVSEISTSYSNDLPTLGGSIVSYLGTPPPGWTQIKLAKKYPVSKTVSQTNGNTTQTSYTYSSGYSSSNWSYSHPLRIMVKDVVSGNTRTTDLTYSHKTSPWVFDLIKTVKQSGVEAASFDHDSLGRRTVERSFGQNLYTFGYHSAAGYKGRLRWADNALGHRTELLNWKSGSPQLIKRADNSTIQQTIDSNGWLLSSTDALGTTTSYTYDNMGRMKRIDLPGSWTDTNATYNFSGGGVTQTVTKGAHRQEIIYDSLLRPVQTLNRETSTNWVSKVETEYDGLGRVVFTSLPSTNGTMNGTRNAYDGLGRITETKLNGSTVSRIQYLSAHRTRTYDALNKATTKVTNGFGEVTNIWQPEGVRTIIYRNNLGNPTRIRQLSSTGYSGPYVDKSQNLYYDNRQRLCAYKTMEGSTTKYEYDSAGQLIAYAKGQGSTSCGSTANSAVRVSQAYDVLGRPTVTNFAHANTPDIVKTYDLNGNILTVNRGSGASAVNWTYTYNNINMLTSEKLDVDGRNYDSAYSYNAMGFLTQKVQPGNQIINYTMDGLGRMKTVKDGVFTLASNTSFHANGSLHQMRYGNGQNFTQTLNSRLLPQRLYSKKSGGRTAIDLNYVFDAKGLITSQTDGVNGNNSRTYSYDGLGRLTQANSGYLGMATYEYDSLGNIRKRTLGSRTIDLTYDSRNRLSKSIDSGNTGSRTVAYDARGNVTTLGNLTFVYDTSNQPIVVSGTANGVGSANGNYTYDGNMKRVKSVVNGKTIYNIYDASGSLLHVDERATNKKTDYITGPMGTLARIVNGQRIYVHPDHLGSPRELSNSSGGNAGYAHYSPFGLEVGPVSLPKDQAGFTGHLKDSATGLNYMQARYYDPVIGRFLSFDPLDFMGSGENPTHFNRYAYVANDPINGVDPFGLARWEILVGDPGQGRHNQGDNFDRAAQTRADELTSRGHDVTITRVSTIEEVNAVLESGGVIDGGIVFFGHASSEEFNVGENSGRSTNISASFNSSRRNISELARGNFGPDATAEICGCNAGSGGMLGVAQAMANQMGVPVEAYTSNMSFSPIPGAPNIGSGATVPSTGPLYMTPDNGRGALTFSPSKTNAELRQRDADLADIIRNSGG